MPKKKRRSKIERDMDAAEYIGTSEDQGALLGLILWVPWILFLVFLGYLVIKWAF